MIKQLLYALAAIVLLFFAIRLMSKVKDDDEIEQEIEDTDVIANRESGEAIQNET